MFDHELREAAELLVGHVAEDFHAAQRAGADARDERRGHGRGPAGLHGGEGRAELLHLAGGRPLVFVATVDPRVREHALIADPLRQGGRVYGPIDDIVHGPDLEAGFLCGLFHEVVLVLFRTGVKGIGRPAARVEATLHTHICAVTSMPSAARPCCRTRPVSSQSRRRDARSAPSLFKTGQLSKNRAKWPASS